jgi:hypothetical protein
LSRRKRAPLTPVKEQAVQLRKVRAQVGLNKPAVKAISQDP